ncbi:MAG: hypothetical protein CSB47_03955 [Proteobacteria bacterium]|nr:MAG: hypothetical protein CSB47_03955 [Pseudomonadota bacterium]
MQTVVDTLCSLAGVRYAGIYQDGEPLGSNFPESQQAAMMNSSGIMSQIFFALDSVQKTHDELYFGVEGGYLAAFCLDKGRVALLLTDRKVNFPMISMAVKSASETIKHQLATKQPEQSHQQFSTTPDAQTATPTAAPPVEDSLQSIIEQYTHILTDLIGSSAHVMVDEAVTRWKKTYVQTPDNLPYLLMILKETLESDQDKEAFMARAADVPASIT